MTTPALVNSLATILENKIKELKVEKLVINVSDLDLEPKIVVEAFKILQVKNIGKFIIGRRGHKSRFEIGKIEKVEKNKKTNDLNKEDYKLESPENGPFSDSVDDVDEDYLIVSQNYGFKLIEIDNYIYLLMDHPNGYSNVCEAVDNYSFKTNVDLDFIKTNLQHYGFVELKS